MKRLVFLCIVVLLCTTAPAERTSFSVHSGRLLKTKDVSRHVSVVALEENNNNVMININFQDDIFAKAPPASFWATLETIDGSTSFGLLVHTDKSLAYHIWIRMPKKQRRQYILKLEAWASDTNPAYSTIYACGTYNLAEIPAKSKKIKAKDTKSDRRKA